MSESNLIGVSASARAVEKSEETIRVLERKGIVTSIRDSSGKRLFTPADVCMVLAHYAGKKNRKAA